MEENMVSIPLRNKSKEIVAYTIVDKDIYNTINFTCCFNKDGYAQAKINGASVLLHRFVLKAIKGDPIVDHINGDKLDNRKENLRFITYMQNSQNKQKKEGTSSKYIGVHKRTHKYGIRWMASVRINNIKTQKSFVKEEHAAYYYDSQVIKHYQTDEFTPKINGIEEPEDYEEVEKVFNPLSGPSITKNNKYQIKIQDGNKTTHLGTFETKEEAKGVYNKKKKELTEINLQKKVGTEIIRNKDGIAIIVTTKGEEILVDDDKYFDLRKYTWSLNVKGYALAGVSSKNTTMHRYLLNAPFGIKVDHINNNRIDNRVHNLRFVDDSTNSHNSIKRSGTTSKYIGVHKNGNKFYAEIKKNHQRYSLGSFSSEIEAAYARDKKAIELYGDCAKLNLSKDEFDKII